MGDRLKEVVRDGGDAGDAAGPPRGSARVVRIGLVVAAACALGAIAAAPHDAAWQEAVAAALDFTSLQDLRPLVSPLGKGDVLALLACIAGVIGLRRLAGRVLVALLLVGIVVATVKPLVGRERPDGSSFSFPSGDAAGVAAAAMVVVVEAPVAVAPATAVVVVVAASRLALGKHYPSDVLAGAAIGILAAWVAVRLVRKVPEVIRWWAFALLGVLSVVAGLSAAGVSIGQPAVVSFALLLLGPALIFLLPGVLARFGIASGARAERTTGRAVAATVVVGLALSWFLATRSSLWDRDEPRFARATVEMLESGDWLVPTFNGALRPDKPILIYWLMSLPARVWGQVEWSFRAWSGVALVLTAALVAVLAARLFGRRSSGVAALVMVTAPLTVVAGTAATTDAVLLALVTGACALVVLGSELGWPGWTVPALGATLGLALLTKGPVGLAPPLLLAAVVLWRARRTGSTGRALRVVGLAMLVGVSVFLAWGIPANAATGGELARVGLGYHLVARTIQPLESHGGNPLLTIPFYLVLLPVAFFPWIGFVPAGIAAARAGALGGERGRDILLGWTIPFLVLISLVQTKLPHYMLPVFPALALLVAGAVSAAEGDVGRENLSRWLRRGVWLVVPAGVLLGGAVLVWPWFTPLGEARAALSAIGVAILALTWSSSAALHRGNARRAAVVCGVGLLVVWGQVALALPRIEESKLSPAVATIVRSSFDAEVPVAAAGYTEASLVFYVGRPIERLRVGDVAAWAARPGPGALVIGRDELDQAGGASRLGLEIVAQRRGVNLSKGRWLDVVVCRRPARSGG